MQQHRSSREVLGTAPVIKLWALGASEKFTIGKSHLYMVYAATCPSPQISLYMVYAATCPSPQISLYMVYAATCPSPQISLYMVYAATCPSLHIFPSPQQAGMRMEVMYHIDLGGTMGLSPPLGLWRMSLIHSFLARCCTKCWR